MANGNSKILTAEQEMELLQPIKDYVGKIQTEIDGLRKDGTDKVVEIQNVIDGLKRDKSRTKSEKDAEIAKLQEALGKAKAVEAQNKDKVSKLIADAEKYLQAHFDKEYYQPVKASCDQEKVLAKEQYKERVAKLEKEHQQNLSKLSDHQEIKDEKYVHKNRLFDAKMELHKNLQEVKDRRHAAFSYKYHLIDLLRMSRFTFGETMAQRWENYKYTFNRRSFL